jgi:hypothetical protein
MVRKKNMFWTEKVFRRIVQIFGSRFYIDVNRDIGKSILVAGTARSGTTWLADIIAGQISCRLLFEPFNSNLVGEYQAFQYFQYMRPDQQDASLYAFARKVFSGQIRNQWVDKKNEIFLPKFRLIKEIRANLLLRWLHQNFPEVPLFFIIRNPCAVVLSRMELRWATDRDIEPFLTQPNLIDDHLSDHIDFIKNVDSDEEKHAIIWCVSNLIPLKQFPPEKLQIIFYENLCTQPEKELSTVFKYIQRTDKPLRTFQFNRPSITSKTTSAVVTGKDKISRWKNQLTTVQINKILNVVSTFDLDYLYGESLVPNNLETKNYHYHEVG